MNKALLTMILPGLMLAGCIDKDTPKPPPWVPKPRIEAASTDGPPVAIAGDPVGAPRSAAPAQRPPATSIKVP